MTSNRARSAAYGRLPAPLALAAAFGEKTWRGDRITYAWERMLNPLDLLAMRYGSDKFGEHWYTQHYHAHFRAMRHRQVNVLEIGIGGYDDPDQGGASLRMWRDYFPQGQIVGLDIHSKTGIEEDRIHVFQGSQTDPRAITALLDKAHSFDIIIDDGSHRGEMTIQSFQMLFPFVTEGGWYVIEDTQTAYWPDFGGSVSEPYTSDSLPTFLKRLVDGLNWQEIHQPNYAPSFLNTQISGIHFYHNMAFIHKGGNMEGSNRLTANRYPAAV